MGRHLRCAAAKTAVCLLLLAGLTKGDQADPAPEGRLKRLSLEQLGNIEVTTASREPVKVLRTPAAIYVITQEDIRPSGAASIPEALLFAPGVTVARIASSQWAYDTRVVAARQSPAALSST